MKDLTPRQQFVLNKVLDEDFINIKKFENKEFIDILKLGNIKDIRDYLINIVNIEEEI